MSAKTVGWLWKQKGRTDADAWHYQYGYPELPANQYDIKPVADATALVAQEAEIAALRKDKERLDWMINTGAHVCISNDCEIYWVVMPRGDGANTVGTLEYDPRKAIDTARTALAKNVEG